VLALFDPPTGSLKYRRGGFSGAAISWSGEFDLGAAPGGYAHVSSDDGNFWWVGGIDGTAGVWAARSTKPDAGTDWTPGFQPRKTLADPGVVAANGPGATSIPAVVGLGTDRALMVWSKSNSLRWATVSDASGFGPVGTVTSDSRLEDWGIVRAGKYVYLVQRTVRSNEFRLFVYDIAAGTWSAGTSPGVSGEVSGNDGIPLSAQRDDIYAFYTWDGAENVGKGEDRIVRYKKYTGPGAAGKWSAPTDLTVGGRLNGDHITTPSATAGEPMVIGWIVDDDDVQGTGQAIEYYAGLEAASRAVGQGVVRRTNAPGAPPPNMPLMAVAIAFSAATATATVIATRTSKPTVRPKR